MCWGDSLTAAHVQKGTLKGYVKSIVNGDDSYPGQLASMLGDVYEIENCGVGGETTLDIMARQGAAPMYIAQDIILPNDSFAKYKIFLGSTSFIGLRSSWNGHQVTPLIQGGFGEHSPAHLNTCYIGGRPYEISSEAQNYEESGTWLKEYNYFIRPFYKVTHTDTIPKGSKVTTEAMRSLRGAYSNIFFMGQNGGFSSVEELINQYRKMIAFSRCNRYIILGFHKCNPSIPTPQRMQEMKDSLTAAFGQHYIDLHSYMATRGLKDAGMTATQTDRDSMAHNQVPPQLMVDGCHFKKEGYKLIADLVYKKMRQLGY